MLGADTWHLLIGLEKRKGMAMKLPRGRLRQVAAKEHLAAAPYDYHLAASWLATK